MKNPPPDTDRKVLVLAEDKRIYICQYLPKYNFWGKFVGKRFLNSFSKLAFEVKAVDWEEITLPDRWRKIEKSQEQKND